jgi:hypothetical protein
MSSVYLETSFFSECCTVRTGEIARGRRATSLTWNQKHLANPNKRTHLTIIAARARLRVPELVTPDLMRLE